MSISYSVANSAMNSVMNSVTDSKYYRKLDTDPALISLFCNEVRMQLEVLNPNVLRLEAEGFRPDILAALMRAAHSLKGAGRMVHIDLAVCLAHELENYFVVIQKTQDRPDAIGCDILFQSLDALDAIATRLHHFPNDPLDQEAPIVLNCVRAIANLAEAPSPPPPPIILTDNSTSIPSSPTSSSTSSATRRSEREPTVRSIDLSVVDAIVAPIANSIVDPIANSVVNPIASSIANPIVNPVINPVIVSIASTIAQTEKPPIPEPVSTVGGDERTVRLSRENLSRLMGLVGESLTEATWLDPFGRSLLDLKTQQAKLIELLDTLQTQLPPTDPKLHSILSHARDQANRCRSTLLHRTTELEEYASRSSQLANRLYQEVIESQMRPFSDVGLGFPRMVRDLARQMDKQIKLEIIGKHTSVDRDILDHLEAPLTHLLRNAIDHGIESQDDRQLLGKPLYGTIYLTAKHIAGSLIITVQDDGRGINLDQLRQHIINRQLATSEMAEKLTDLELMEFLYLPGFSTANYVTELSGRGVGLDVVHTLVQSVGGTLTTHSQPGQGTTFSLHLPLTRSLLRTLVVEIAGHPYAFPMTRIDRILTLSQDEVQFSENRPYFLAQHLNNHRATGLLRASDILNLTTPEITSETLTVLQISDNLRGISDSQTSHYGLIVDRVLGEEKLVVKPIHPRLGKIPNLNSVALRSDGTIAFIIDSEDFLQSMKKYITHQSPTPWTVATPLPEVKQKYILVVDDSITVRETERKLLENQGYRVDTAINGMDGWNALQFASYDLLITDIDMPRMNGIELICRVKQHQSLAKLPTIIISYKDRDDDRRQGLEVGADYYLTKSSFHDDTLVQAVLDLIGPAETAC